jgi:hypothetical protein
VLIDHAHAAWSHRHVEAHEFCHQTVRQPCAWRAVCSAVARRRCSFVEASRAAHGSSSCKRLARLGEVSLVLARNFPLTSTASVGVRVELAEGDVRRRVKNAGGKWDPRRGLWVLRYDQAMVLGLVDRIVSTEG